MALEEYLLPEEKVLATVGTYHATNKRVIRYRKKFLGEEMEELPYPHITSLSLVSARRKEAINSGIALFAIGLLLVIINIFVSVGLLTPLSILGLLLGIILLILGVFFPIAYFQLRAPGITGEFIIKKANSEEAKKFAAIVREHIYR